MNLRIRFLQVIFGIFIISSNLFGQTQMQNITPSQAGSFNVDNLSDAQVKRYMEQATQSGYSEAEIELALRARGLPQMQIDKLKSRIAKLQSGTIQPGSDNNRMRTNESDIHESDALDGLFTDQFDQVVGKGLSEKYKSVFGYKLFNSETLTFEPNLNVPTPQDYLLGPGDEVIVDVWGASEQTYRENISPDGYIKIPNLGPIYLNGLSIEKATERIKSRLIQIYSGLSYRQGVAPNTFTQVSLGQLRTIKVHVIGEARRPGTYNVSSLSTMAHALYLSGGPNYSGSMRNIEIIRDNKVHTSVDIYHFLMNGTLSNNVNLKNGDIIRIRPYINRVEIEGEVKRVGIYETIEGETFAQLLEYAGGFTEKAYTKIIKVKRNDKGEKLFADFTYEEFSSGKTRNGDQVIVQGLLERYKNRVQINGAVFREGQFELVDGLTIKTLVESAEGLRGDAFMERGQIFRTNEDYSYSVLSFNLRNIYKGTDEDLLLQREDIVQISSIYDLKDERYIIINGEVKNSGTYPYSQGITVETLIIRAGGLRESASESRVEVARRIQSTDVANTNQSVEIFNFSINKNLELNGEDSNFTLEPYDQVFIRKTPGYEPQVNVKVEGEVIFPGLYALEKKNERISEIIQRAGGITDEGFPEGATLIRRTEYNPPKSDEEKRLDNLAKLLQSVKTRRKEDGFDLESEAEMLQEKRLENVQSELDDYYSNQDASISKEALRIKREQLQELARKDSVNLGSFARSNETIGIDLDKILENPGSKYDMILQDGDVLSIPRQIQTVRMRGELLYPITARYDEELKFRDYISKSGGFSDDARKKKSFVIYANGSVDRTRKIIFWNKYPHIDAGAEIMVPKKPERRRSTMTAAGWIAMATAVATLALVVQNLTN